MIRCKRISLVLVFVFAAVLLFAFTNTAPAQAPMLHPGTVAFCISDDMVVWNSHQSLVLFTETYDDNQIQRLFFSITRAFAGRGNAFDSPLLRLREAALADYTRFLCHQYTPVTAHGKGRLSMLALSLGGHSPPVCHG